MDNKDQKRKSIKKWILRIVLAFVLISLTMYSLFMTVENSMYKRMLQEDYQNYRKSKSSFESEKAAYQDTIRTLRQKTVLNEK